MPSSRATTTATPTSTSQQEGNAGCPRDECLRQGYPGTPPIHEGTEQVRPARPPTTKRSNRGALWAQLPTSGPCDPPSWAAREVVCHRRRHDQSWSRHRHRSWRPEPTNRGRFSATPTQWTSPIWRPPDTGRVAPQGVGAQAAEPSHPGRLPALCKDKVRRSAASPRSKPRAHSALAADDNPRRTTRRHVGPREGIAHR
jgi:hypothetical protein